MAVTYDSIASTTISTTTDTVTFSGISSSYTDLILVANVSPITGGSSTTWGLRLNGDTGANYYRVISYAASSTNAATSSAGVAYIQLAYSSADEGGNGPTPLYKINIFDIAGSNRKTITWESAVERNTSGSLVRGAGMWDSTSAITSVTFFSVSAVNILVGSTISLYGIAKA